MTGAQGVNVEQICRWSRLCNESW